MESGKRGKRRVFKFFRTSIGTLWFILVCYLLLEVLFHATQQYGQNTSGNAKGPKIVSVSEIFFVESSLSGKLTMKQLVGVESAAYRNPHKNVVVFVMTNTLPIKPTLRMNLLTAKYRNLKYVGLDVGKYFKGTSLERWYLDHNWSQQKFSAVHLSEAFRYLYLYKFGGVYLDLDVISLKELKTNVNALTYDNKEDLSVCFMAFEKEHPLMLRLLDGFAAEYHSDSYNGNGCPLLTKTYRTFLDQDRNKKIVVQVLPLPSFHPVLWVNGDIIFDETRRGDVMGRLGNSTAIHYWAERNKDRILLSTTKDAFMELVRNNSPVLYAEVAKNGWKE